MMSRPFSHGTRAPAHQLPQRICEIIRTQHATLSAGRPFVALSAGRRGAGIYQRALSTRSVTTGRFATRDTSPAAGTKQAQASRRPSSQNDVTSRNSIQAAHDGTAAAQHKTRHQPNQADLAELVSSVDRITRLFLAQQGIPSEQTTLAALRACARADVSLIRAAGKPADKPTLREGQADTTASHLLELDSSTRRAGPAADYTRQNAALSPQAVIDRISEAVWSIICHPAVYITPQLLAEYVKIQARLGKPETLPHVLSLYASKPKPRLVSGSIQYAEQNPKRSERAVEAEVAETALDAAIKAKNLDAAVAIIESTYATEAFARSKLLKKGVGPVSFFAAVPVAIYFSATGLSHLQNSMDPALATNIVFAGLVAYVGVTAAMGMVVITTANDQMKRVTWAPGTPLRQRWLREEERAALDKVACSFGFSEQYRYGEEEGKEFQSLREYILRKGMILDAVELMEGMT